MTEIAQPDLAGILSIVAAIAAAVLAGVYLAFSVMVMPALRGRPAREAVAVMQAINRYAVRPPFMIVFFGAPLLAVAVIVVELMSGGPNPLRVVGAAVSIAGFIVTVAANVPINNAVEQLGLQPSKASLEQWPSLAARWTSANTLRGALCALAAVLLLVP